jgi:hypothetical protein
MDLVDKIRDRTEKLFSGSNGSHDWEHTMKVYNLCMHISRTSQLILQTKQSYFHSEAHLNEMSFEDKRTLLQNLFGGTDKDGKRFGVYVEKMIRKGLCVYTIKGAFIEEVGLFESGNKLVKQNMQRK